MYFKNGSYGRWVKLIQSGLSNAFSYNWLLVPELPHMRSGALSGLSPAYGTIYTTASGPDRGIHTDPTIAEALEKFSHTLWTPQMLKLTQTEILWTSMPLQLCESGVEVETTCVECGNKHPSHLWSQTN